MDDSLQQSPRQQKDSEPKAREKNKTKIERSHTYRPDVVSSTKSTSGAPYPAESTQLVPASRHAALHEQDAYTRQMPPAPSYTSDRATYSGGHDDAQTGMQRRMHSQTSSTYGGKLGLLGGKAAIDFPNSQFEALLSPGKSSSKSLPEHIWAKSEIGVNVARENPEGPDRGTRSSRDLEHVLDPDSCYHKLESLEFDTAKICGLAPGPNLEDTSEADCFQMIQDCGKALRHLKSEGFCGDRFSILLEDPERPNVASTVHLSLQDIDYFLSSYTRNSQGAILSLRCKVFGIHTVNRQVVDDLTCLRALSNTLSIGLLSFSGSHVCPFASSIWHRSLVSVPVGIGYSYQSRPLACLKNFLGGPAWVLTSTTYKKDQPGLNVSLTVEDVQELWGPVQFVGGNPTAAPVLRTLKGFIVALPRARQHQVNSRLGEIECHWTQDVPSYVEESDHIWLHNDCRLIIGTDITNPSSIITVNHRCKSKIRHIEEDITYRLQFPGTRSHFYTMEGHDVQLVAGYQGFSLGFIVKRKRHPGITLKDCIIWECQQSDTNIEAFLKLQIGLEISACTGNARRVSLWEVIRLYHIGKHEQDFLDCGHGIADPHCVRSCWTGTKYLGCLDGPLTSPGNQDSADGSSYSINTEPSLPSDNENNDFLDRERFRKAIISSILRLKNTGIDHEGHLQACWPFSSPAMSHRIKSSKLNKWLGILSDSRERATFAVVSSRCLGFDKERFPTEWSPCPKSHQEPNQLTCLSTRVLRRPLSSKSRRFKSRQFGFSSPTPDPCPSELAPNTVFRIGETQFMAWKVWQESDNADQNMMAFHAWGNPLRDVTSRLSGATEFKEQTNPELKGGQFIDLVILPKSQY